MYCFWLQKKFQDLLAFGRERLVELDVWLAFGELFFNNYNRVRNERLFREAVDRYTREYGDKYCTIEEMLKVLKACGKLEVNNWGGYCNAGEL